MMDDPHQLALDPEDAETCRERGRNGTCAICGASLAGRRQDAVYCGGPCRAEASRVRRLREGQAVDGYGDLPAYSARRTRTRLNWVLS